MHVYNYTSTGTIKGVCYVNCIHTVQIIYESTFWYRNLQQPTPQG